MTDYPKVIDKLKLFFGDPLVIENKFTIYQPTIGDIVEYGELEFYSMLSIFTSNTTSRRLALWDSGVDWNKITDFELFASLVGEVTVDQSRILFGDLDWSQFKPYRVNAEDENSKEFVLFNPLTGIDVDEGLYEYIALYLRTMFQSFPKQEFAKGRGTKEAIIEEERQKIKDNKVLGINPEDSSLLPLLSACVNHPGFKYKKSELKQVGIFEFMDAVSRLQVYEQSTALLKGVYSGFVDTKGINSEEFNFMRDIKPDAKHRPKKGSTARSNGKV